MTKEEQKIKEAKQLLLDDQKRREEGFNKELAELKKKWGVEQHPTVGNEIINTIVEAVTSVPINIVTRSK